MFVWFVRILISTVTQCKGFVAYIMTTKYLLFVSQDFELDCSTLIGGNSHSVECRSGILI